MTGHNNLIHYVTGSVNTDVRAVGAADAYADGWVCPSCGERATGAIIASCPGLLFIRCPGCGKGAVQNDNQLAPTGLAGEPVDGLPAEVAGAYREARICLANSAHTACELMCRKILMHVAIDKEGADEGKSFTQYLDILAGAGYVTKPMKPWVDLIRQHANLSTHRLPAASFERATNTLAFTAQLLKLIYEVEHRAQIYVTPQPI
jgi:hypothetical protein